jgi:thymidylate synthase ThyX
MTETGSPLRVYTLDGLSPEVVAVTFAKTSRVPDSFEEIARELSESESSRFHEKWVIGYGHSSVAEHAVLSIAIENVSILGAKLVEESRLSSFTEKSTRYQVMSPDNYYTPPVFASGVAGEVYRKAVAALYATYDELMPEARAYCDEAYGGPEWTERGCTPKGKACDSIRGLLPAAAKTNMGWTVNARSLRHGLVRMASSPLDEMRSLAVELRRIGEMRIPTLLKYTDPSPYQEDWEERMTAALASRLSGAGTEVGGRCGAGGTGSASTTGAAGSQASGGTRLVHYDENGEASVLAALLFRAGGRSYNDAQAVVEGMNEDERKSALGTALAGMTEHEAPVREFENTSYTFEITCDFGAYRDIQRHRMTTQTQQLLTCDLGYAITDDARAAGLAGRVEKVLKEVRESWRILADVDPKHAQYVVPLAYNKRFLMRMNFREALHFVRLRSKVHGHESYRRVAWAVKREIERVHPLLGELIPVDVEGAPAADVVVARGNDRHERP